MKRKIIKIISASGLAIIMGIGTLCGVLIGPMNSTRASTSGSEENLLTPQEQLLAGTLELDPENDPVIYTTDYGLDIHWHMAGLPENSADITNIKGTNVAFIGNAYFNYAGFNWAIIGYSNKNATFSSGSLINLTTLLSYYSSFSNPISFLELKDSDAATAIYNANLNKDGLFYNISSATGKIKSVLFPRAKGVSELEGNEVLCFAQTRIDGGKTSMDGVFFDDNSSNYSGSNLQTYLTNWYNNNLTGLPIVSKNLITKYYASGVQTVTITSQKLFPLACGDSSETFYAPTYMTADGKNPDLIYSNSDGTVSTWWLRSGILKSYNNQACCSSGGWYYTSTGSGSVTNRYGVRPAFVLKI